MTLKMKLLCFFIGCLPGTLLAQQPAQYNRLQYHHYKWNAFHTSAFHIYFPTGYHKLCTPIADEFTGGNKLIHKRMGVALSSAPNIIIYPSTDQLYESNIGSFEPADQTLPTFVVKGNRLLLAYTGSKDDLKTQLYEGIVRAVWTNIFNEALESQLTGTKSFVPYWMKEGMIAYFSRQWPIAREDALHRLLTDSVLHTWDAVVAREPVLAGQAFCYFLSTKYYPDAPKQLLLLLRKRKPLHRALRLLAKTETASLYEECLEFYRQRILPENVAEKPAPVNWLTIAVKKGRVLNTSVNNQQTAVAYTIAGWHQRTVYVYDIRSRKQQRIACYKLPPWMNDHTADRYPIVSWSNGGDLLLTYPDKGKISIHRYLVNGRQADRFAMAGVDGINSMLTAADNNHYLLAAWHKGQSDIVSYQPYRELYTPYINDDFDDAQPVLNPANGELHFVSVRPLSTDKKDSINWQGIFKLKQQQPVPVLVDTIDYVSWHDPQLLGDERLLAVTSLNGREQYTTIDANGHRQLGTPFAPVQYRPASGEVLTVTSTKDSLYIHRQNFAQWFPDRHEERPAAWLMDYQRSAAARAAEDSILKAADDGTPSFLDGVFGREQAKAQSAARKDSIRNALRYDPKKVSPYILQLYSAYFTAKVNNDYFINRYQPYAAYQGNFRFPQLGGMAQGGFSDLFENHHFNIAFRIPAGTEGSDFFVKYRNTAKRLDWGLAYYRKSEDLQPDPNRNWVAENGRPYPNTARAKTNYYELSVAYPLNYFSDVRFTLAARQDKTVFLATEKYSLEFPSFKSLWGLFTLAYQYNRLQPTLPMLHKGFSGSIAIDGFKGFTQQEEALAGISMKAAYHLPIYKYITLVGQLQAGYSGGDNGILYNMGGIDNNMTPRVDSAVHFAQTAPYAFQTLVTPLRGYFQNSVYGSKYALLNLDVYFPVFQTLVPLETPLSAINHLQVGLFADVAGAGGKLGFSTANSGFQAAYGFSARTMLAGYPLRFDMGWPGSFAHKPVWYLSLNIR